MAYYIYQLSDGDVLAGNDNIDNLVNLLNNQRGVVYEEGLVRDWTYLTFDSGVLVLDEPELAADLRVQRNELLRASDYTQLPDVPVNIDDWAAYRQELRDLPEAEGFPETVVFPTQPEG